MGPFVRLPARVRQSRLTIAFLASLLLLLAFPALAQDQPSGSVGASPSNSSASAGADDGVVSIGGEVVMRLRSSAGGLSVERRVDTIEDRLTRIVAVPDIKTSDVIVYTSAGKPPVIYVLGRRLITVDAATVKAAGGGNAKQLAIHWAKRLQQILPRVNIRLPSEPDPVVPPNPPLKVTSDLTQVEGNVGDVVLRGKTVMRFRGIQTGNVTAAERADMLSERLNRLANKLDTTSPDAVSVVPADSQDHTSPSTGATLAKAAADTKPRGEKPSPASADNSVRLLMGGKVVYKVTDADTKAAGGGTPLSLAQSWAKNIRVALGIPPNGVPANPPDTTQAPAVPAAATPPPPPPTVGQAPAQPAQPAEPGAPTAPAAPGQPSAPAQPPANTAPPAAPGQPAAPAQPPAQQSPPAP
ncbi:MAG TPA: hypothetical protein VFW40_02185 [Capsulimonadaceae bacterium]|nr:hypothetical protein [Capsulimonadaceae bacterium]